MAISFGSSSQSRQDSLSIERVAVADSEGDVVAHIIKYRRNEETTEEVSNFFGCPSFNGEETLSATVTSSVDEALVESPQENAAPQYLRFYNPKKEATVTFLGSENPGSTFAFDGSTFDTISSEVSETAGDVKRVTIRGIAYGQSEGVTVGNATGGGISRFEKRYSNTDFAREFTTSVSFS